MRLTIDEYSKNFKMSKEMIHSKIKAKKLNYIIENSVTYIIVTKNSTDSQKVDEIKKLKTVPTTPKKSIAKPRTTVATVLALYQRENKQLKEKILQLETKIDKLIDDKEQMLRDERDKIEEVYSTKDAQLKNILELINSKLMLEQQNATVHEIQSVEYDTAEIEKKESKLVELRSYLKTLDLKAYQRKIIKKRFLSVYDSDIRITQQNGKLYLDFSKYDYSDLLDY